MHRATGAARTVGGIYTLPYKSCFQAQTMQAATQPVTQWFQLCGWWSPESQGQTWATGHWGLVWTAQVLGKRAKDSWEEVSWGSSDRHGKVKMGGREWMMKHHTTTLILLSSIKSSFWRAGSQCGEELKVCLWRRNFYYSAILAHLFVKAWGGGPAHLLVTRQGHVTSFGQCAVSRSDVNIKLLLRDSSASPSLSWQSGGHVPDYDISRRGSLLQSGSLSNYKGL